MSQKILRRAASQQSYLSSSLYNDHQRANQNMIVSAVKPEKASRKTLINHMKSSSVSITKPTNSVAKDPRLNMTFVKVRHPNEISGSSRAKFVMKISSLPKISGIACMNDPEPPTNYTDLPQSQISPDFIKSLMKLQKKYSIASKNK